MGGCSCPDNKFVKICRDAELTLEKRRDAVKKRKERRAAQEQAKRLKRESSLSQSSLEDAALDTAGKKLLLDQAWGRAFYANGIPFRVAEDPFFVEAFNLSMRYDLKSYKFPSRYKLAGPILDDVAQETTSHIERVQGAELKKYGGAILVDGASHNPQRRPLVNVICETPSYQRLSFAKDTTGSSKTKDYVADLMKEGLEKLPLQQRSMVSGW